MGDDAADPATADVVVQSVTGRPHCWCRASRNCPRVRYAQCHRPACDLRFRGGVRPRAVADGAAFRRIRPTAGADRWADAVRHRLGSWLRSPRYRVLIAGRIVQGAGASAGYVLARVVRDIATDDRQTARMMAPLFISSGTMMICGPLIGEALIPFMAVAGRPRSSPGLLVAGFACAWLVASFRDTVDGADDGWAEPDRMARTYSGLFVHGRYFAYLFTHCCAYGASYTFIANAPFIDLANGQAGRLAWVSARWRGDGRRFLSGLLIARRLAGSIGVPGGALSSLPRLFRYWCRSRSIRRACCTSTPTWRWSS